jgi:hypothetical protein
VPHFAALYPGCGLPFNPSLRYNVQYLKQHAGRRGMAGSIFISYRRTDDPGFAQAVYLRQPPAGAGG